MNWTPLDVVIVVAAMGSVPTFVRVPDLLASLTGAGGDGGGLGRGPCAFFTAGLCSLPRTMRTDDTLRNTRRYTAKHSIQWDTQIRKCTNDRSNTHSTHNTQGETRDKMHKVWKMFVQDSSLAQHAKMESFLEHATTTVPTKHSRHHKHTPYK